MCNLNTKLNNDVHSIIAGYKGLIRTSQYTCNIFQIWSWFKIMTREKTDCPYT